MDLRRSLSVGDPQSDGEDETAAEPRDDEAMQALYSLMFEGIEPQGPRSEIVAAFRRLLTEARLDPRRDSIPHE